MFYEREDFVDLYQVASEKEGWNMLLITSEIHSDGIIGKQTLTDLLNKWSLTIKDVLNDTDAAYRINLGNIFLLIKNDKIRDLLVRLEDECTVVEKEKATISSTAALLTVQDSENILQIG